MKFSFFLAVVLAAGPALFCQSEMPEAEQEHLRTVLGRSTNSPQDLIRALEQHIAKFPDSPKRAEMDRALVKAAIEIKDNRRIVQYGELVLRREPSDLNLLDNVSRALLPAGDRESTERALSYARRYEKAVAEVSIDKDASGAEIAKTRDTLDNSRGRALLLQAEALAALGQLPEAIEQARKAFDAFPGSGPAAEIGKWYAKLGRQAEAARAYADAFTVPDSKTTDSDRAGYRRLLGEAYTRWKGSETGLGDIVLEAYDRNLAKVTARVLALKQFDPNLGLSNPMEFTLRDVRGENLNLASLTGKVVVMDFWATWCGPCRIQHPLYEEVKKKFAGRDDVVFLAISTDEDRELVKPFLEAQKWNQRVFYEDGLARALRITSIPTTIVIDKRGGLATRMNGFDPEQFVAMLTDRITDALK